MINIVTINESTVIADSDVQAIVAALEKQWNSDLAPVWDLEPATLTFKAKDAAYDPLAWQLVFLDDSDQADALAYHDVTASGMPISKVFVKTIQGDKSSVSVAASHELCEMAVDPTINLAAQDNSGSFWAYEVCDPVEDDEYGYEIDGILVSDFVTPAWFGYPSSTGKQLDFMGHATTPFVILSGGYAQKFTASGWQQLTGLGVSKKRALTAPRGSRRERRARGRENWVPGKR
jgi:hypothetical protein